MAHLWVILHPLIPWQKFRVWGAGLQRVWGKILGARLRTNKKLNPNVTPGGIGNERKTTERCGQFSCGHTQQCCSQPAWLKLLNKRSGKCNLETIIVIFTSLQSIIPYLDFLSYFERLMEHIFNRDHQDGFSGNILLLWGGVKSCLYNDRSVSRRFFAVRGIIKDSSDFNPEIKKKLDTCG